MPQSPAFNSRQNSSVIILGPDGNPAHTSGRFPKKGDDRTYQDFHNLNVYEQVLYTYESSNGYRDNRYLIFFPREDWYQERQKYSIRSAPAFRQVVDAMVAPVFEKPVVRTSNNKLFDMFIENADNTGTPLSDIIETCQTHARMFGITFLVMDNLTDADQVPTLAGAMEKRICPYIYEKMPHQVYCWKTNNWGKLEWISFFDKTEDIVDRDGVKKVRQYYRRWDNQFSTLYWEKVDEDGKKIEIIQVEKTPHGLNYLPVYPIMDYTKTNNLTHFPMPIMSDLANLSFIMYNVESWLMLLAVYCFPMLILPDMDTSLLAVSSANAIKVPNDAKFPPQFINGSVECLQTLIQLSDRLEDKIYRCAGQMGVSGSKVQQQVSGISKEWDFRGSNTLLCRTAAVSRKTEEKWIAKTFGDYIHTDITYTADYPTEFVQAYSQARMDAALSILNGKTPPPENLAKELWVETAKVFFDDDPARQKQITDQINSGYAQELKDKADSQEAQAQMTLTPISSKPEENDLKNLMDKMLGTKKTTNKFGGTNNKSLKADA
jgi:hypothetical protein